MGNCYLPVSMTQGLTAPHDNLINIITYVEQITKSFSFPFYHISRGRGPVVMYEGSVYICYRLVVCIMANVIFSSVVMYTNIDK